MNGKTEKQFYKLINSIESRIPYVEKKGTYTKKPLGSIHHKPFKAFYNGCISDASQLDFFDGFIEAIPDSKEKLTYKKLCSSAARETVQVLTLLKTTDVEILNLGAGVLDREIDKYTALANKFDADVARIKMILDAGKRKARDKTAEDDEEEDEEEKYEPADMSGQLKELGLLSSFGSGSQKNIKDNLRVHLAGIKATRLTGRLTINFSDEAVLDPRLEKAEEFLSTFQGGFIAHMKKNLLGKLPDITSFESKIDNKTNPEIDKIDAFKLACLGYVTTHFSGVINYLQKNYLFFKSQKVHLSQVRTFFQEFQTRALNGFSLNFLEEFENVLPNLQSVLIFLTDGDFEAERQQTKSSRFRYTGGVYKAVLFGKEIVIHPANDTERKELPNLNDVKKMLLTYPKRQSDAIKNKSFYSLGKKCNKSWDDVAGSPLVTYIGPEDDAHPDGSVVTDAYNGYPLAINKKLKPSLTTLDTKVYQDRNHYEEIRKKLNQEHIAEVAAVIVSLFFKRGRLVKPVPKGKKSKSSEEQVSNLTGADTFLHYIALIMHNLQMITEKANQAVNSEHFSSVLGKLAYMIYDFLIRFKDAENQDKSFERRFAIILGKLMAMEEIAITDEHHDLLSQNIENLRNIKEGITNLAQYVFFLPEGAYFDRVNLTGKQVAQPAPSRVFINLKRDYADLCQELDANRALNAELRAIIALNRSELSDANKEVGTATTEVLSLRAPDDVDDPPTPSPLRNRHRAPAAADVDDPPPPSQLRNRHRAPADVDFPPPSAEVQRADAEARLAAAKVKLESAKAAAAAAAKSAKAAAKSARDNVLSVAEDAAETDDSLRAAKDKLRIALDALDTAAAVSSPSIQDVRLDIDKSPAKDKFRIALHVAAEAAKVAAEAAKVAAEADNENADAQNASAAADAVFAAINIAIGEDVPRDKVPQDPEFVILQLATLYSTYQSSFKDFCKSMAFFHTASNGDEELRGTDPKLADELLTLQFPPKLERGSTLFGLCQRYNLIDAYDAFVRKTDNLKRLIDVTRETNGFSELIRKARILMKSRDTVSMKELIDAVQVLTESDQYNGNDDMDVLMTRFADANGDYSDNLEALLKIEEKNELLEVKKKKYLTLETIDELNFSNSYKATGAVSSKPTTPRKQVSRSIDLPTPVLQVETPAEMLNEFKNLLEFEIQEVTLKLGKSDYEEYKKPADTPITKTNKDTHPTLLKLKEDKETVALRTPEEPTKMELVEAAICSEMFERTEAYNNLNKKIKKKSVLNVGTFYEEAINFTLVLPEFFSVQRNERETDDKYLTRKLSTKLDTLPDVAEKFPRTLSVTQRPLSYLQRAVQFVRGTPRSNSGAAERLRFSPFSQRTPRNPSLQRTEPPGTPTKQNLLDLFSLKTTPTKPYDIAQLKELLDKELNNPGADIEKIKSLIKEFIKNNESHKSTLRTFLTEHKKNVINEDLLLELIEYASTLVGGGSEVDVNKLYDLYIFFLENDIEDESRAKIKDILFYHGIYCPSEPKDAIDLKELVERNKGLDENDDFKCEKCCHAVFGMGFHELFYCLSNGSPAIPFGCHPYLLDDPMNRNTFLYIFEVSRYLHVAFPRSARMELYFMTLCSAFGRDYWVCKRSDYDIQADSIDPMFFTTFYELSGDPEYYEVNLTPDEFLESNGKKFTAKIRGEMVKLMQEIEGRKVEIETKVKQNLFSEAQSKLDDLTKDVQKTIRHAKKTQEKANLVGIDLEEIVLKDDSEEVMEAKKQVYIFKMYLFETINRKNEAIQKFIDNAETMMECATEKDAVVTKIKEIVSSIPELSDYLTEPESPPKPLEAPATPPKPLEGPATPPEPLAAPATTPEPLAAPATPPKPLEAPPTLQESPTDAKFKQIFGVDASALKKLNLTSEALENDGGIQKYADDLRRENKFDFFVDLLKGPSSPQVQVETTNAQPIKGYGGKTLRKRVLHNKTRTKLNRKSRRNK